MVALSRPWRLGGWPARSGVHLEQLELGGLASAGAHDRTACSARLRASGAGIVARIKAWPLGRTPIRPAACSATKLSSSRARARAWGSYVEIDILYACFFRGWVVTCILLTPHTHVKEPLLRIEQKIDLMASFFAGSIDNFFQRGQPGGARQHHEGAERAPTGCSA